VAVGLLTVGQVGQLRLWNADTGAKLGEATVQPRSNVCLWSFYSLPGSTQVLAAGTLGTACTLDAATGRVLREIRYPGPKHVESHALVDGGKTFLALDNTLSLTRFDPASSKR